MIKTVHATIVVERDYPVPPARVFAAFADPDAYRQWHVPNGEWVTNRFAYDFRIGGELLAGFGKPGESRYVNKPMAFAEWRMGDQPVRLRFPYRRRIAGRFRETRRKPLRQQGAL